MERRQAAFWQDWQFWQLVVAAAAALLGFFTHALDRKRDREKERAAAKSLAVALHAEVSAIRSKAGQLFGLIGQGSGMPAGAIEAGRALGIPKATVFEANADRLGLLPPDVCRTVIDFYGIRTAAEAQKRCWTPRIQSNGRCFLDGCCSPPTLYRNR